MNLNKLLAENMVRFGTKNLSSNTLRTLLNEGVKAGGKPETDSIQSDYSLAQYSSYDNTIGTWLQPYDSIKTVYGMPGDKLLGVAAMALATATMAELNTNNKYKKQLKPGNSRIMYDSLGSGPESGKEYVIQVASSLTTKISYKSNVIDVYPNPKAIDPKTKLPDPNTPYIATLGTAGDEGVLYQGEQKGSPYGGLIKYLNRFNFGNVCSDGEGVDFTQYDLATMVDTTNYVNLLSTTAATNKLIVYSRGSNAPAVAGKEITSTTVGASGPVTKQYDVSFDTGVSTIPANDTAVSDAVKDAIAMFPDGNITNLTVVSSASPEYNSAQGGPKTLADYGQTPTSGTGDPGAGTTDIAKNIKLAYDRGVSFMTALNAGLAAAGKPQVTSYTVNWQISDKGGTKVPGRYAEVQWEKAGNKGTEVKGATSTGTTGATTDLRKTYNIMQHVFSW